MPEPAPKRSDDPAPPGAFAQGTGVMLQTVGMLLLLSGCCIFSLAGQWEQLPDRGEMYRQLEQGKTIGVPISQIFADPARGGVMLTVVFSTVGGLALAGFGLGMQSQQPRAASAALISNVLLLIVLIVAGAALWIGEAGIFTRLWHAVLTLIVAILLGFVCTAWRQVRANPPPAVWHSVPPGFDIRDVMAGEKPSKMKIKELRARLEIEQRELERLERELENPDADKD